MRLRAEAVVRALPPALFLAALLAAPAAATEHGTFILLSGADTIAVETFHRGPDGLSGELVFRAQGTRTRFFMTPRADASISHYEQAGWSLAAAPDAAPTSHAAIEFQGDSAITEAAPGGSRRLLSAPGAVVFVNPSVTMMEQMVRRARAMGRDTAKVQVFRVTGGPTIPFTVRRLGADSTVLDLGGVEVRLATDAAGAVTGGRVPSQGLVIRRAAYDERALATVRPDYSAPAGAPYTAETVRVPTPGGFTLVGTLTRPKPGKAKVPAVVTITGSGAEDRDEYLPTVAGYRPFRQIADALARRGIAVLRLDDRGYGESGGDFASATTLDFANDTRAAVAWLRTRTDIAGDRIALLGHSEGGLIAPMVAADDPALKAIVLMAGPSRNGRRILEYQNSQVINAGNPSPATRDSLLRRAMRGADSVATTQAWMRFFLSYDPIPTAKRVRTPVLILQGTTDRQVTADQAPELEAAFRQGGNRDVTMRRFEDANHLFLDDPIGDPAGYSKLLHRQVRADVIDTLSDWLVLKLEP